MVERFTESMSNLRLPQPIRRYRYFPRNIANDRVMSIVEEARPDVLCAYIQPLPLRHLCYDRVTALLERDYGTRNGGVEAENLTMRGKLPVAALEPSGCACVARMHPVDVDDEDFELASCDDVGTKIFARAEVVDFKNVRIDGEDVKMVQLFDVDRGLTGVARLDNCYEVTNELLRIPSGLIRGRLANISTGGKRNLFPDDCDSMFIRFCMSPMTEEGLEPLPTIVLEVVDEHARPPLYLVDFYNSEICSYGQAGGSLCSHALVDHALADRLGPSNRMASKLLGRFCASEYSDLSLYKCSQRIPLTVDNAATYLRFLLDDRLPALHFGTGVGVLNRLSLRREATIVFIDSLELFYVQLAEFGEQLRTMMSVIEQATTSPMCHSILHELVIAKFQGSWNRAMLRARVSPTHYRVYFVDYGNEADVGVGDVRRVENANLLTLYPPFAVPCALKDFNSYAVEKHVALGQFLLQFEGREVDILFETLDATKNVFWVGDISAMIDGVEYDVRLGLQGLRPLPGIEFGAPPSTSYNSQRAVSDGSNGGGIFHRGASPTGGRTLRGHSRCEGILRGVRALTDVRTVRQRGARNPTPISFDIPPGVFGPGKDTTPVAPPGNAEEYDDDEDEMLPMADDA